MPHNRLTVYEHETVRLNKDERLNEDFLGALQAYYGEGLDYFELVHEGVRFSSYVGVLQIGQRVIEILPKVDRPGNQDKGQEQFWRTMLIEMLRAVNSLDVAAPSQSSLRIKPNSILELYIEIFLHEVDMLLRRGLVKQYSKQENNQYALKGALQFPKHIQRNLVHAERFYTRYNLYDNEHILNRILFKTLRLVFQINTNPSIQSWIGSLLLRFPEVESISVTDSTFKKLRYNRKTEDYLKAMEIARMLLLNYHPDIRTGQNNVLALMFDMNLLWERFVYISLRRKSRDGWKIHPQCSKRFWRSDSGRSTTLRPDIVIEMDGRVIVLDTKWKHIGDGKPSSGDLQQMYAYAKYFGAKHVALLYPGEPDEQVGTYYDIEEQTIHDNSPSCSIIKIGVGRNIGLWQQGIANQVDQWIQWNTSLFT